jgi:Dr1-associated corepressor
MDDALYAPQSPDLSGEHVEADQPIHPQHQEYRGSISHSLTTPFTPTDSANPFFAQSPFGQHTVGAHSYFPQQQQQQATTPQQRAPPPAPYGAQPGWNQVNWGNKRESNGSVEEEEHMGKKVKAEAKEEDEYDEGEGGGDGHGEVEVRTKFPVARIKRIMQSDEDIGKVAQVTPVVVCKSFYFFFFSSS